MLASELDFVCVPEDVFVTGMLLAQHPYDGSQLHVERGCGLAAGPTTLRLLNIPNMMRSHRPGKCSDVQNCRWSDSDEWRGDVS